MPPRPPRRRGSCTTTRLRVTGKPRQRAQAASTSQRSYVSRRFLAVGATPCRRSGLGGCGWPCGQERADHEVAALVVEDGDRGVRPRTRPAPPVRTGRSARRAQAPTRVRVTEGSAVMVRTLYPSPHSQAPHRPSPLPFLLSSLCEVGSRSRWTSAPDHHVSLRAGHGCTLADGAPREKR